MSTTPREPEAHTTPDGRPLVVYILPDATRVLVDDTAAKGAETIEYTLIGGRIVTARRESSIVPPAWAADIRATIAARIDRLQQLYPALDRAQAEAIDTIARGLK